MIWFILIVAAWIIATFIFGEMVGYAGYALGVVAVFCSAFYAWLKKRVESKRKRIVLSIIIGIAFTAVCMALYLLFLTVASLF